MDTLTAIAAHLDATPKGAFAPAVVGEIATIAGVTMAEPRQLPTVPTRSDSAGPGVLVKVSVPGMALLDLQRLQLVMGMHRRATDRAHNAPDGSRKRDLWWRIAYHWVSRGWALGWRPA